MKLPKIPQGWKRLRPGTKVLRGDRYKFNNLPVSWSESWTPVPSPDPNFPVLTLKDEIVIRRSAKRKVTP